MMDPPGPPATVTPRLPSGQYSIWNGTSPKSHPTHPHSNHRQDNTISPLIRMRPLIARRRPTVTGYPSQRSIQHACESLTNYSYHLHPHSFPHNLSWTSVHTTEGMLGLAIVATVVLLHLFMPSSQG